LESQQDIPTRITKYDVFALLAHTIADIFGSITEFFILAKAMLEAHASFVDNKESFHEYAARTIEKLQEGE
jgi:hypothetical protein